MAHDFSLITPNGIILSEKGRGKVVRRFGLLYSSQMRQLLKIAPVAGLCSFGLALYAAIGRHDFVAAGTCFGVFLLIAVLVVVKSRAESTAPQPVEQTQRSGPHSRNIQAGRDVNIGGGSADGR